MRYSFLKIKNRKKTGRCYYEYPLVFLQIKKVGISGDDIFDSRSQSTFDIPVVAWIFFDYIQSIRRINGYGSVGNKLQELIDCLLR